MKNIKNINLKQLSSRELLLLANFAQYEAEQRIKTQPTTDEAVKAGIEQFEFTDNGGYTHYTFRGEVVVNKHGIKWLCRAGYGRTPYSGGNKIGYIEFIPLED